MGTIDSSGNHHQGKGNPDGGKFTSKTNSAPGTRLTDRSGDPCEIEVPIQMPWGEDDATGTIDASVTVPALTDFDAPVGFILNQRGRGLGNRADLRIYNEKLYIRTWKQATAENLSKLMLDSKQERPAVDGDDQEQVQELLQDQAGQYAFIDDEIWEETTEPVYYVQTFGLGGGGNGSTGLFIGKAGDLTSDEHAAPEWVFPAHQREDAIWYTRQLAQKRREPSSADRAGKDVYIEGTNHFVSGSTFRAAPRLEYTPAYDAIYGSGDPAHIQAEFDRFKHELRKVPGAVIDVDDGWGGRMKRVDSKVLTVQQAEDYNQYQKYISTIDG